jgi:stage II sporulation protein AB (anti-sigma F factor)
MKNNYMKLKFPALSENESFARVAVAAFVSRLDPTLDELTDLKTVVSEAVTNAIIHGYDNNPDGEIAITAWVEGTEVILVVEDQGRGIEDLDQARQPLYTSRPELERSGMGFTIMENFMDSIDIVSAPGQGTKITMAKRMQSHLELTDESNAASTG